MNRQALEFDDIQHILLTRAPALTARYEFLSFGNPAGGRAWLAAILETVHSAEAMRATVNAESRWLTVAFTWNGLRALGVSESSLATFPEEFRQGMATRAQILGDTGANHPDHWIGGLAGDDLHAIVILFARDLAERARCQVEHEKLAYARCERRGCGSASLDLRGAAHRFFSITLTTTLATATGFPNRPSRAPGTSQRPVPERR